MAMCVAINEITKCLDNKQHVIGLFMDLSKAFDTVNHNILLQKLDHYEIRGSVLEWFRHYLIGRQQFVVLNNTKSELNNISCGVPQGSILGPLMFLLYVNDLYSVSNSMMTLMFADDTTMFLKRSDIVEMDHKLNPELRHVNNWLMQGRIQEFSLGGTD